MTPARRAVTLQMQRWETFLEPVNRGWNVLEVGIDGDERPSGNYKAFSPGNTFHTLDIQPECEPSIAGDLCHLPLKKCSHDLIICSQVLEHVWNLGGAIVETARVLKPGGHLILDMPFMFPYHGLPDTRGADDYWRLTTAGMNRLLEPFYGSRLIVNVDNHITAALAQKKNCEDCGRCDGGSAA